MTDRIYCTARDVYDLGIARGSLSNPGRVVRSIGAATDSIDLGDHGFSTGDPVTFRAESGGALPSPLVAGTTYYAVALSASSFGVTASVGGARVDFSTAGSSVVVTAPLPMDAALAWGARLVDELTPAHCKPIADPVPEMIRIANAELAAAKLGRFVRDGAKSIPEVTELIRSTLAKWARGVPASGTATTGRANVAVTASATLADSSGILRFGGLA